MAMFDTFKRLGGANRHLVLGVGANIAGKVWVMIVQILTIAVLPKHWGAASYGLWLVLTAVPTYVALGGLGFGNAAATDMTVNIARNQYDHALKDFQSVWILVTATTCVLVALGLGGWQVAHMIAPHKVRADTGILETAVLLSLYSLLVVQTSLVQTGYRCTLKYALGTALMDLITFAEGVAVIVSALMGGHFVTAALSMLVIRLLGHLMFYIYLRMKESWFHVGIRHADFTTIKRLAKPAMGSLGLVGATALSLQGVLTMIGIVISPTAAAIYGPARTLCRLPLQLSDLLGRASLPELTTAYAKGQVKRFRMLTLMNLGTALVVTVPFFFLLTFFGKEIARFISRGSIPFDNPMLFALLSAATMAQAAWTASGQTLQAVNRHHVFSFPYIAVAALTALAPFVFAHFHTPLVWVAGASATGEGAIFGIALYFALTEIRNLGRQPQAAAAPVITQVSKSN